MYYTSYILYILYFKSHILYYILDIIYIIAYSIRIYCNSLWNARFINIEILGISWPGQQTIQPIFYGNIVLCILHTLIYT
jgi:hypothetical protein